MIYSYNAVVAKAHIYFDFGDNLRSSFIFQFHDSLDSYSIWSSCDIKKVNQWQVDASGGSI